jgi:hypothetical protein
VARLQGWLVSRGQCRQRVQWQQRQGRRAKKRGLAGVVRAMVIASKMGMVSDDDDNHNESNDSDNNDEHDKNGIKDGNNDDDADNDGKHKDDENGDGNRDNDEDNDEDEQ